MFENDLSTKEQKYDHTALINAVRREVYKWRHVPNQWMGATVENRLDCLPRLDYLRTIDACVRLVSIEPLLEDLGYFDLSGIHWVIVGGESGPKARPMKREWVVNIQNQCDEQRASFFFKQWGGWGADGKKRAKKLNGRLLDGRTWDAVPIHAMQYCEKNKRFLVKEEHSG